MRGKKSPLKKVTNNDLPYVNVVATLNHRLDMLRALAKYAVIQLHIKPSEVMREDYYQMIDILNGPDFSDFADSENEMASPPAGRGVSSF